MHINNPPSFDVSWLVLLLVYRMFNVSVDRISLDFYISNLCCRTEVILKDNNKMFDYFNIIRPT